ncbi:hypothetical protein Tco_0799498 [Tanacetum coccineum]|uniref:Uncharacterized protein n=1 Tax=Tanacetum coccineum TaxID=301880 RepID=A0ABQ4ZU67_9ASTR
MMSLSQEGETLSRQSVKESSLVYETSDVHAIQNKMPKAKERCMSYFRSLHSHLQVLSNEDPKGTRTEHGFKWAFISLFGQDVETFTKRVNERQMQSKEGKVDSSKALDASLVFTEYSGTKSDKKVTSSTSGNYSAHVLDADIRPVNDQVPFAKVQLIAQHNVLANEQQHSVQFEPIYNTHMLEKDDSNTTPDSTNMCHRGGDIY